MKALRSLLALTLVSAWVSQLARQQRSLHLLAFYHYNWVSANRRGMKSFDFGGLFKLAGWRFVAKPAYQAFRRAALAMEGCRVKGSLATQCRRR